MKYFSSIVSVICLALIGFLFYLFFNHTEQIKKISVATEKQSASTFRIAYFEMDSLEAHYNYFKDALAQLKTAEAEMNGNLAKIKKENQDKIAEWQKKGTNVTQAESQLMQQEYEAMGQRYQDEKQKMQEKLASTNTRLMTDIKSNIETYLKDYNRQKNFSFIFSYDQTTMIFYKDTAFNITNDLVAGLNAEYEKKKKN